jgi:AcrR family transcriptional regulator
MAILRTPREAWIEAGLRALANGGPEAVRIEVLAEALGVTKGGFYGQFSDRNEFLREMLDSWAAAVFDQVVKEVESRGGDARTRLHRLFEIARYGGEELLRIELAIRDWARRDPVAAGVLRRVDEQRMDYMRSLFRGVSSDEGEVEARCLLAFSLFIGSGSLSVGHGERSREEVLGLALQLLIR